MNAQLLVAGILSLIATFAHALTGEYWIFSQLQPTTLPHTPFGDSDVTKRMLRVVWHFVTVDFLGSAIVLILLGFSDSGTPRIPKMISLHFAGYALVGILVAIRRVSGLVRGPQLFLFVVIAILAWWGAS